jgi:TIR domain
VTADAAVAGETGPPRVFISHASEDKAFVVEFATRLRARGVDAWLDRWEILPGDSLVQKIFDDGLGHAKAVIVVISGHSVDKPWVREELDVAVVQKINHVSKLIPVILDDTKVPSCLQATLWERIADPKSYDDSLERIVLAIFGGSDKPPIGGAPAYAAKPILTIGDLTRADSVVLQAACERAIEIGYDWPDTEDILSRCTQLGISGEAAWDSIKVLKHRDYLIPEELLDRDPPWCRITTAGMEEYLKAYWPDYEGVLKKFASCIINEGLRDRKAVEVALKVPVVVLDHVFGVFVERKWLFAERYPNGQWEFAPEVYAVEMKRWLES